MIYSSCTYRAFITLSLGWLFLSSSASASSQWVCNPTQSDTPWLCDLHKEGPTVLDAFASQIHSSPWVVDTNPNNLCGGYYVEPTFPFPKNPPLNTAAIAISSDQSTLSTTDGKSHLQGEVLIAQGNRFLRADQAIMTRNVETNQIQTMTLAGQVRFIEPGLQFYCDHALANFDKEEVTLYNTDYYLLRRHAQGTTSLIRVDNDHSAHFMDTSFSTCPKDDELWSIHAKQIDLNQAKGRGTATHARLHIKEVPVFYLPYIDFPIDNRRQSGFLYPSFGSTTNSGFDVRVPYYVNLAPNYDLTITPRLLTDRGIQTQGRYRYLSDLQEGEIRASILPSDNKYTAFKQDKRLHHDRDGIASDDARVRALDTGANRYALAWEHSTQFNDHWAANIDYHRVGDDNYFIDLGNGIHANGTERLKQEAELTYADSHWTSELQVEEYQTLHPYLGPTRGEVYRKQPQWLVNGNFYDVKELVDLSLIAEATNFNHKPDPNNHQPFSAGYRFHVQPGVSRTWSNPWGYIKPRMQWAFTAYELTLADQDKALNKAARPTRSLPNADIDSGLFFERNTPFGLQAYRQTLEPRLYYHWTPYIDQNELLNFDSGVIAFSYDQMFRSNRFSGIDRIGDANQLTAAMTTRFVHNPTGVEKLRLSVGEVFYFRERQVSLCDPLDKTGCQLREDPFRKDDRSTVASFLQYQINSDWRTNAQYEWNPNENQTQKTSGSLSYLDRENRILHMGYEYVRRDLAEVNLAQDNSNFSLQQTDFAFAWPVDLQWRAVSRWHYDIEHKQTLDVLGGLEYDTCCLGISVFGSRYLRGADGIQDAKYAKAVFLQFMLKGLSTLHWNRDSRKDATSIPGFKPFAETDF
jgi:LPS-assembly protein